MIGSLRGKVIEHGEETVIMDVGGVGYELNCSLNTLNDLQARGDDEVQVVVHTQLREDSLTLFGFSRPLEKRMFLSLLKVTGVGPKSAIKILSGASVDHLAQMIEAGDVKALSGLPKVAKKTAEQIILTLKGKLVIEAEAPKTRRAPGAPEARFSGARADVLSALVNLGFRFPDAEKVVSEMDEAIDVQQGVRQGLQVLTGSF